MKNLLNCHCIGLHSFPISIKDGLYKRIFYADTNHELWEYLKVAIHPHHVDIKITILDGHLFNPIYKVSDKGVQFKKYRWNSHILNGNGGFEYLGEENLIQVSNNKYSKGDSVTMKACELHTIQMNARQKCVWLIEETIPSCEYFPINYSVHDLEKWTPDGLYEECSDEVKDKYIQKYLL